MLLLVTSRPNRLTRSAARLAIESAGCTVHGFSRGEHGNYFVAFTGSREETNAAFPLLPAQAGWRRDDPNDRSLRGAPGKWLAPLECPAAFISRKIRKAARAEFEGKGWSEERIQDALAAF